MIRIILFLLLIALAAAGAAWMADQPGDLVMTTAGLHAKVVETSEATLDLEIAPGVVSTWDRRVIRERLTPQEPTAAQDLGTTESPENPDGPTGPDSEK